MFGASNNNNPNSGTGTGTGLFGQSTNQPAAGGTGLFGQSTTQPAAGTSLFGSSTTQPATGSNIFGQSTAQPASTGTNIFGQSQANTNSAFGGGGGTSLFGARPAYVALNESFHLDHSLMICLVGRYRAPALNMTMGQSQQQVGQPVFTKSTKFNDLPEDVKKVFEQIE
jgi:nucleoporin p58/p45